MINQLHCKDNLKVLNTLPDASINLIYSDILYGTGKKFKDYTDIKANREEIYSHYVPKIKEMHRVLKLTGTMYLQMDLRIVHWLRCICDDVFGYENFRNEIIWKYNLGGRGKREFAKKHDNIIVYTKSNTFTFNDEEIRVPYKSVISKKQDRPNITAEKLKRGTIPTNVWDDIPNGLRVKKRTDYYSEKHPKLLRRIIQASSNEGDTVADFYMGSGNFIVEASKLGRKFIGCDINPYSIECAKSGLEGK